LAKAPAVADGMVVSVHYTLKTEEGEVIDSSDGDEPLMYLHGAGNIVPGLEKQLAGHVVGDRVKAVVEPEDGYGEHTGDEPQMVPRESFPEDADLYEGMEVMAQGPEGEMFPMWIVGLTDDHVLVDENHPLAGVTLHFDVEVTEIRAATQEELAHGHPHGPGAHAH
jgi:FKBP-type peptidyl-prolyl cis-trans isomerase SlyD